jgi:alpha-D-ribose 1-methylphosphonate 5-triphosphate synthase subunit PhnI
MGYVAVRGGAAAIENSEKFSLVRRAGGASGLLTAEQIREQLYFAVDRVMGEGSLYAPDLAALAFKQAAGDSFEAAFILRSYRTTLPRIGYSEPVAPDGMRVIRRISAAFNIDRTIGRVMDGMIVVDLTKTDRKTLQRYMGVEGAAAFLAYHGSGTDNDRAALADSDVG